MAQDIVTTLVKGNVGEVIKEDSFGKTYYILGEEISFSAAKRNYFILYGKFRKMASKYYGETVKAMEFGGLEYLVKNAEKKMENIAATIISESTKILNNQGIYDIDAGILAKMCAEYYEVDLLIDELYIEPYYEILQGKEAAKDYRRARKAGRSKAVAFGFGMNAYMSARVQAGAINMATGMGHSLVNAVGNMATNAAANSQMSKICSDKSRREKVGNEMYSFVMSVFVEVANAMIERGVRIEQTKNDERNMARALINNIVAGNIPKEQEKVNLLKALSIDPFNDEAYKVAIQKYGNVQNEIGIMAADFGLDISNYVISLFDNLYKEVRAKSYDDEQEVRRLQKEARESASFYGLEEESLTTQYLEKEWEKIDLKKRTAGGHVFDTREEAEDYTSDSKLLRENLESTDFNIIDLLNEDIKENCIREKEQLAFKSTIFQNEARNKILEFIKPYVRRQNFYHKITSVDTPWKLLMETAQSESFTQCLGKRIVFDLEGSKVKKQEALEGQRVLFVQDTSMMKTWNSWIAFTDQGIMTWFEKKISSCKWNEIVNLYTDHLNMMLVYYQEKPHDSEILGDDVRGIPKNLIETYNEFLDNLLYLMHNFSDWEEEIQEMAQPEKNALATQEDGDLFLENNELTENEISVKNSVSKETNTKSIEDAEQSTAIMAADNKSRTDGKKNEVTIKKARKADIRKKKEIPNGSTLKEARNKAVTENGNKRVDKKAFILAIIGMFFYFIPVFQIISLKLVKQSEEEYGANGWTKAAKIIDIIMLVLFGLVCISVLL